MFADDATRECLLMMQLGMFADVLLRVMVQGTMVGKGSYVRLQFHHVAEKIAGNWNKNVNCKKR